MVFCKQHTAASAPCRLAATLEVSSLRERRLCELPNIFRHHLSIAYWQSLVLQQSHISALSTFLRSAKSVAAM